MRLLLHHECWLRRLCNGSPTASADRPVWSALCNEAADFTLCYDPIPLLALPRPGRLLPSLRRRRHHLTASVMTTQVSVNSCGQTFTGKTRGLMGCEQRHKEDGRIFFASSRLRCSKPPGFHRSSFPWSCRRVQLKAVVKRGVARGPTNRFS